MTHDEIKNEAESIFRWYGTTPQSFGKYQFADLVRFAKHCVDKANGWIPLTESMPEPMVQVLMWDGAQVFVEQWWGNDFSLDHRITHWMPIPQPPEAA